LSGTGFATSFLSLAAMIHTHTRIDENLSRIILLVMPVIQRKIEIV
jgi:hypothetical protein